jgi:hypothetical protein
MSMTLEEAAEQLRGAGFLTRMQTFVDHKGESTESIFVIDRNDAATLADRLDEPQFGIDQYKNKHFWYAFSIFASLSAPRSESAPILRYLFKPFRIFTRSATKSRLIDTVMCVSQ